MQKKDETKAAIRQRQHKIGLEKYNGKRRNNNYSKTNIVGGMLDHESAETK
jgi:hypothetical protein